jgi:signal transduction histidine kinase
LGLTVPAPGQASIPALSGGLFDDAPHMTIATKNSPKPTAGSASSAKKIRVWFLLQRTIELAVAVDVVFFLLFQIIGSPIMAWVNVLSIALYATAYALLKRHYNKLAVLLVWTEVSCHAVLGSLMLGWDGGFHYYLLMFLPTIFLSTTSARRALLATAAFLAFYLYLDFVAHSSVALEPINPLTLLGLRYFNFSIVFVIFGNLCYLFFRELAHARARQEEQQSELTRFLAVASHDLRQPMHALNLYLGALTAFELPEPTRPLLANVTQCAHIMDEMFLALLDLSRLDAQVVLPLIERFPIASLLSRLAVEFTPQANAKGIDLRIRPNASWVETDAALVEQILRNLVANAVRYTNAGSIAIICSSHGGKVRVAVQDTGIGISWHQQETVFEEFKQVGNAGRDRTKGLGLGLAIVRRLCRLLGVPITLVSAVGQGSTFSIDLPLATGQAAEATPDMTRAADAESFYGKMVVVVDDEESILDAMRALIEQWGCLVVTAASSDEAIAKLAGAGRLPNALICDWQLRKNESGFDVIRTLREEFNHGIPALLITGDTSPERLQETQASGLPVLYKPLKAGALRAALGQLLQ